MVKKFIKISMLQILFLALCQALAAADVGSACISDSSCGSANMKCVSGVCVCGMPNVNSLGIFGDPAADPSWTLVDISGGAGNDIKGRQYATFQVTKGTTYRWSTYSGKTNASGEDYIDPSTQGGGWYAACSSDDDCAGNMTCFGSEGSKFCDFPFNTELTLYQATASGPVFLDYSRESMHSDGQSDNQAEIVWKSDFTGQVYVLVTNYAHTLQAVEGTSGMADIYTACSDSYISNGQTSSQYFTTLRWQEYNAEHCDECGAAETYKHVVSTSETPTGHHWHEWTWEAADLLSTADPLPLSLQQGRYMVFDVTEGNVYRWSSCSSNIDSQLTLFKGEASEGNCGTFIAYSDDSNTLPCADGSKQSLIVWQANFTGKVTLLFNEYNCSQCIPLNNGSGNSKWAECYNPGEKVSLAWQNISCDSCSSSAANVMCDIDVLSNINLSASDQALYNAAKTECQNHNAYVEDDSNKITSVENTTSFTNLSDDNNTIKMYLKRGSRYLFRALDGSGVERPDVVLTVRRGSCNGSIVAQGYGSVAYSGNSERTYVYDIVYVSMTALSAIVTENGEQVETSCGPLTSTTFAARITTDNTNRFEVVGYPEGMAFHDSKSTLVFAQPTSDQNRTASTWAEALNTCSSLSLGADSVAVACPPANQCKGNQFENVSFKCSYKLGVKTYEKTYTNINAYKYVNGVGCRPDLSSDYLVSLVSFPTGSSNKSCKVTDSYTAGINAKYGFCDAPCIVTPAAQGNLVCPSNYQTLNGSSSSKYCQLTSCNKTANQNKNCISTNYASYSSIISDICPTDYSYIPSLGKCVRTGYAYPNSQTSDPDYEDPNVDELATSTSTTCPSGYELKDGVCQVQGCDNGAGYMTEYYFSNISNYTNKCFTNISESGLCVTLGLQTGCKTCCCNKEITRVGGWGSASTTIPCPDFTCPSGKTWNSDLNKCVEECDGRAQWQLSTGKAWCYTCDDGSLPVKVNGEFKCRTCPANMTYNSSTGKCVYDCPSGYEQYNDACRPVSTSYSCPSGYNKVNTTDGSFRCDKKVVKECPKVTGNLSTSGNMTVGSDLMTYPMKLTSNGVEECNIETENCYCMAERCDQSCMDPTCPDTYRYNNHNYTVTPDYNPDGSIKQCTFTTTDGTVCGQTGWSNWALPNIAQLYQIVDFDLYNPVTSMPIEFTTDFASCPNCENKICSLNSECGNGKDFVCLEGRCQKNNWFWSNTPVYSQLGNSEFVWGVNMTDGRSYRARKGCDPAVVGEGGCDGVASDYLKGAMPHRVLCVKGTSVVGELDRDVAASERIISGWACDKSNADNEKRSNEIYLEIKDANGVNIVNSPASTCGADVTGTIPGTTTKGFKYGPSDIAPTNDSIKGATIQVRCGNHFHPDDANKPKHAFEVDLDSSTDPLAACIRDTINGNASLRAPFYVSAYAKDLETEFSYPLANEAELFVLQDVCGDALMTGSEQCDPGTGNFDPYCRYGYDQCEVCQEGTCQHVAGIPTFCGDYTIQNNNCASLSAAVQPECNQSTGAYEKCDCGPTGYFLIDAETGKAKCDQAFNIAACPGYGAAYIGQTCLFCVSCGVNEVAHPYCGDGIVQHSTCENMDNCIITEGANEACDDGEMNNDTVGNCTTACQRPVCGDGIVQTGEVCDDGAMNGQYSLTGTCDVGCQGRGAGGFCGDGTTNGDETCDAGADNDKLITYKDFLDTLSADERTRCTIRADVDPENLPDKHQAYIDCVKAYMAYVTANPGCNATCSGGAKYCGDGSAQQDDIHDLDNGLPTRREACDQGFPKFNSAGEIISGLDEAYNGKGQTYCALDCSTTFKCGDGNIQKELCSGASDCEEVLGANEFCDDGSQNSFYNRCNDNCTGITGCGDGGGDTHTPYYNYGEECNDRDCTSRFTNHYNISIIDSCNNICKVGRYCGDGFIDSDFGIKGLDCGSEACPSDFERTAWKNAAFNEKYKISGFDINSNPIYTAESGEGNGGNWMSCDSEWSNCQAISSDNSVSGISWNWDTHSLVFPVIKAVFPRAPYFINVDENKHYYFEYDYKDFNSINKPSFWIEKWGVKKNSDGSYDDDLTFVSASLIPGYSEEERLGPWANQYGYTWIDSNGVDYSSHEGRLDGSVGSVWKHVRFNRIDSYKYEKSGSNYVKTPNTDAFPEQTRNGSTYKITKIRLRMEIPTSGVAIKNLKFYAIEDGLPQTGNIEYCDNGKANVSTGDGDYLSTCAANCRWTKYCGDGIVQSATCIDVAANGIPVPNCLTTPGADEVCDDGKNEGGYSISKYGKCKPGCLESASYCGDGVINRANCGSLANCLAETGSNEQCDNGEAGNTNDSGIQGFTCRPDCRLARCGDGIVDPLRSCTAEDEAAGACNCSYNAEGHCRQYGTVNGCVPTVGNNYCDCNSGHVDGNMCTCIATGDDGKCRKFELSDYKIKGSEEECDCGANSLNVIDGTINNETWILDKDGQTKAFKLCQTAGGDAQYNTNGSVSGFKCRTNCTVSRCGDGIKDADEECDDGNGYDFDSCTNQCKHNYCGDNISKTNDSVLCSSLANVNSVQGIKDFNYANVIVAHCEAGVYTDSCGDFVNNNLQQIAEKFNEGRLSCCYDIKESNGVYSKDDGSNCIVVNPIGVNNIAHEEYVPGYTNRIIYRREYCDNGPKNSPNEASDHLFYCSHDCRTMNFCGEGVAQTGDESETCDIGGFVGSKDGTNMNVQKDNRCSGPCTDGKNGTCQPGCTQGHGKCGDGFVDRYVITGTLTVQVDNGTDEFGIYRKTDSTVNFNEIVEEECDIENGGNNETASYCNTSCEIVGSCGDGKIQWRPGSNEVCDPGNPYAFYCPNESNEDLPCADGYAKGTGDNPDKCCYRALAAETMPERKAGVGAYCVAGCAQKLGYCGDGLIDGKKSGSKFGYDSDADYTYNTTFGRTPTNTQKGYLEMGPEECDTQDERSKSLADAEVTYGSDEALGCDPGSCTRLGSCGDGIRQVRFEGCDFGSGNKDNDRCLDADGNMISCSATGVVKRCFAGCLSTPKGAISRAASFEVTGWACDPNHPWKNLVDANQVKYMIYDKDGSPDENPASYIANGFLQTQYDTNLGAELKDVIKTCGGGQMPGWKFNPQTAVAGGLDESKQPYTVVVFAQSYDKVGSQQWYEIGRAEFNAGILCGDGMISTCADTDALGNLLYSGDPRCTENPNYEETCDNGVNNVDENTYLGSVYKSDGVTFKDEYQPNGPCPSSDCVYGRPSKPRYCGDGIEDASYESGSGGKCEFKLSDNYTVQELCQRALGQSITIYDNPGNRPSCNYMCGAEATISDSGNNIYRESHGFATFSSTPTCGYCGDGIIQRGLGGCVCNDEAVMDHLCTDQTQPIPNCVEINGLTTPEFCDEGSSNNDNYSTNPRCKTDCSGYGPHCGDGEQQGVEECERAKVYDPRALCKNVFDKIDPSTSLGKDDFLSNPDVKCNDECKIDATISSRLRTKYSSASDVYFSDEPTCLFCGDGQIQRLNCECAEGSSDDLGGNCRACVDAECDLYGAGSKVIKNCVEVDNTSCSNAEFQPKEGSVVKEGRCCFSFDWNEDAEAFNENRCNRISCDSELDEDGNCPDDKLMCTVCQEYVANSNTCATSVKKPCSEVCIDANNKVVPCTGTNDIHPIKCTIEDRNNYSNICYSTPERINKIEVSARDSVEEFCDSVANTDYVDNDTATAFNIGGDNYPFPFESNNKALNRICKPGCQAFADYCGDGVKHVGPSGNENVKEECDPVGSRTRGEVCHEWFNTVAADKFYQSGEYFQQNCNAKTCKVEGWTTDQKKAACRYCGDGEISKEYGENCDPSSNSTNTPLKRCMAKFGVYDPNLVISGGASSVTCNASTCQIEGATISTYLNLPVAPGEAVSANPTCYVCGDKVTQTAAGETCDAGRDGVIAQYGTAGCNVNCKYNGYCGDGDVADGYELCDNGSGNIEAGYSSGSDGCTKECKPAGYCGDGILNGTEECDSAMNYSVEFVCQVNGETYGGQELPGDSRPKCGTDCKWKNTDKCRNKCGDGTLQTAFGEECDGSSFGGASCTAAEPSSSVACESTPVEKLNITSGTGTWPVGEDGYYEIEVAGAKGGTGTTSGSGNYGKGVKFSKIYYLKSGTTLYYAVGGAGGNSTYAGGGGGATWIGVGSSASAAGTTANVLMVAGGGGGGAAGGKNGSNASTSIGSSTNSTSAGGGTNGGAGLTAGVSGYSNSLSSGGAAGTGSYGKGGFGGGADGFYNSQSRTCTVPTCYGTDDNCDGTDCDSDDEYSAKCNSSGSSSTVYSYNYGGGGGGGMSGGSGSTNSTSTSGTTCTRSCSAPSSCFDSSSDAASGCSFSGTTSSGNTYDYGLGGSSFARTTKISNNVIPSDSTSPTGTANDGAGYLKIYKKCSKYTGGSLSCTSNCMIDYRGCTGGSIPICGNGIKEAGEACEIGETTSCGSGYAGGPRYCKNDCSGYETNEESRTCKPTCGNGVIDSGETCEVATSTTNSWTDPDTTSSTTTYPVRSFGDGGSTDINYSPLEVYYYRTASAILFTAAELGNVASMITKIAWQVSGSYTGAHPRIWMKDVTQTNIADITSTITINNLISGATQVYNDTDTSTSTGSIVTGWNEFTLSTQFSHAANKNLLVIVLNRYGAGTSYLSCSYGYYHSAGTGQSAHAHADQSNESTMMGNTLTTYSNRPNTKIYTTVVTTTTIPGEHHTEYIYTAEPQFPGGKTCVTEGYREGTLKCNPTTCKIDTSECIAKCGDGHKDLGEVCDKGTANTNNPISSGGYGEICRNDCTPARCGDGIVDPGVGEECEMSGSSVIGSSGTLTCGTYDGSGTLTCTSDCKIDTSSCTAGTVCGNGNVDPGEQCDPNKSPQWSKDELCEHSTNLWSYFDPDPLTESEDVVITDFSVDRFGAGMTYSNHKAWRVLKESNLLYNGKPSLCSEEDGLSSVVIPVYLGPGESKIVTFKYKTSSRLKDIWDNIFAVFSDEDTDKIMNVYIDGTKKDFLLPRNDWTQNTFEIKVTGTEGYHNVRLEVVSNPDAIQCINDLRIKRKLGEFSATEKTSNPSTATCGSNCKVTNTCNNYCGDDKVTDQEQCENVTVGGVDKILVSPGHVDYASSDDFLTTCNGEAKFEASHGTYGSQTGSLRLWTVPATGQYEILAYGASGGNGVGGSRVGCRGASAKGEFKLRKGERLRILVGERGVSTSDSDSGGGGGGGSFVVLCRDVDCKEFTPLVIAGGGGGAGGRDDSSNRQCKPGDAGTNGTKAGNAERDGGTLGSEGRYWGDRETIGTGEYTSRSGYGFNDFDYATGLPGRENVSPAGGWGGGGNGSDGYFIGGSFQGGGGGGYSGGAASNSNVFNANNSGGGGGGSLVNTASGRYVTGDSRVTGGAPQSSAGKVVITQKKYAPCKGCGFDAATTSQYISCP